MDELIITDIQYDQRNNSSRATLQFETSAATFSLSVATGNFPSKTENEREALIAGQRCLEEAMEAVKLQIRRG
jgi:hypothetical protein